MNRKRKLLLSIISALIAGGLVYGVYVVQLKQVEMQETIEVIVPRQFIDAGTQLTERHVATKRIVKAAFDPRMATDQAEVIGFETIIPLAEGEPIHSWKLDHHRLMPRSGESTFQIPKQYVLSIASNVRAGDQVKLYVSGEDGSRLLFSESITVAAVKSSGNTEISDDAGLHLLHTASSDYEQMYISRRYATGAIDHINLNLSKEQWLEIDRLCREQNYKLVIAYSPPEIAKETIQ